MPRSVTGTYTLPTGNPVVSNTTIESVWANTTLEDIAQALTDSLDRQGRGGMSAPFRVPDGTEALPAVAFNSSTGTGMYLDVDSLNFSYLGAAKLEMGNGSVKGNVRFTAPDGTAAAPSYSFNAFTGTGIYNDAANNVYFASNGVSRGGFKTTPGLHLGDIAVDPPSSSVGIYSRYRLVSALTTQYGLLEQTMVSTSATDAAYGLFVDTRFASGAYTTTNYYGLRVTAPTLGGGGHAITNARGILIDDIAGSSQGYGIQLNQNAASGKWALYAPGTARSYHEGSLGIGFDIGANVPKLMVRFNAPAASPAWQSVDVLVAQATSTCLIHSHVGTTGGTAGFAMSVGATRNRGAIFYNPNATTANDAMLFYTGSTVRMQIQESTGITFNLDIAGASAVFSGTVQGNFLNITGDADIATNLQVGGGGQGVVGILDGGPSGQTANGNVDSIVIDGDGNTGISLLGIGTSIHQIRFGRAGAGMNAVGGFSYTHSNDTLSVVAGNTTSAIGTVILSTAGTTRVTLTTTTLTSTLGITAPSYTVGANQVVGSRKTGWTAATGTATRTTFATASVTLPVLAEHVKALIDDLIAHGLIGT